MGSWEEMGDGLRVTQVVAEFEGKKYVNFTPFLLNDGTVGKTKEERFVTIWDDMRDTHTLWFVVRDQQGRVGYATYWVKVTKALLWKWVILVILLFVPITFMVTAVYQLLKESVDPEETASSEQRPLGDDQQELLGVKRETNSEMTLVKR
eukprot:CAMPEP_0114979332 /NCGR_PEP_ID=MMETSP0216-20121206/4309_1 /TAXON_ID=223996 /ORGANISM="Protocruzia adherens, Strain Boccale" /LENGTH=149 /DNA_ID=CAMNT_0002340639 /DNA_START=160 /DNA_END=609 /DNA_ORIENTATION=-